MVWFLFDLLFSYLDFLLFSTHNVSMYFEKCAFFKKQNKTKYASIFGETGINSIQEILFKTR